MQIKSHQLLRPENSAENVLRLQVTYEFDGWRLDRWIHHCLQQQHIAKIDRIAFNSSVHQCLPDISRSQIQRWIKQNQNIFCVTRAHKLRANQQVVTDEIYQLTLPANAPSQLQAMPMELQIVYEDSDLLLIRKPAGIAVHAGPNQNHAVPPITLANALLALWEKKDLWQDAQIDPSDSASSPICPEIHLRPGIVHRLDQDTEGLLLLAKHEEAQKKLSALFAARKVSKEYIAWAWGSLPTPNGQIDLPIARHPVQRRKRYVHVAGRTAQTIYRILQVVNTRQGRKFMQLELQPITGRTHQLRAHLAHHKCPIVGDRLYSRVSHKRKQDEFGLLLFAKRLQFTQPFSRETLDISLELPSRFQKFEQACKTYL